MHNKLSKEKELELINSHTTVPLTEEQVFCFTVTLCDNDIDRDSDRFTEKALEELSALFVGKTGISDHSMRSRDQMARIFHTYLSKDSTKKNALGEPYVALKARAYMLRTDVNSSLISEIEGGIKKEVSISCSMSESTCSICGADMKSHACKHIKGRSYNGKKCHAVLSHPTDAYEWSFVAVPAQPNAGVTKSFIPKEENKLSEPIEIIKALSPGCYLSDDEVQSLKSYISKLEKKAEEADSYKNHLTKEIERLALIALPKVNIKGFIGACESMNAEELRQLRQGLDAQVREKIPYGPQLKSAEAKDHKQNNTSFKI